MPEPATPPPEAPNAVEVGLGCTAEDGHWRSPRAWASPACHVAGLWPACGRDARAPRVWPCERCSWERGHLARNGPKARKAPTGARCPRGSHPRPRRPMPSRSALGALPRTGTGEARERGRRPLGHVAGLWPACGRDARAPRVWPCERCSWERGHLARTGPKARKAPTEATHPSRPPPRPRRPMPSRSALGALPRTGTGEARERGRRPLAHVAGLRPACGRDARAPREWPCERCSWERGHLARTGPKARKAPTEATHPSRLLPRPRRPMPSRSALGALPRTGTGEARERGRRPLAHVAGLWPACGRDARAPRGGPVSDVLGARASCPHRAEGPQSADRSEMPEGVTPPPEAPNAVEVGLGCPAEDGHWRSPERGVARLAMRRACGPLAGGTPALPGCGPVSDVPGSAGILPAPGRRPAKRRQKRHARAGYSPARGAQCRRGRPWVHCRGRALEKPESVGVARLAMWRACGPLAGGTPALPGCGPVSDVPGSAGILPAPGRRPAKRRQERDARAGTPPPEAPNAVEVGLGCTAEDWHWRSPRAWASPAWPCGGPVARLRAGRPRSQGVAL